MASQVHSEYLPTTLGEGFCMFFIPANMFSNTVDDEKLALSLSRWLPMVTCKASSVPRGELEVAVQGV